MAKKTHPLAKLQGTLNGMVFVNSSSYGQYMRAKRSTYTQAVLNDSMQAANKRTVALNQLAMPVHAFLKLYCGRFKHRKLWQQLLQRLRAAASDSPSVLLEQLNGLDINQDYPAWSMIPNVQLVMKGKELVVQLETKQHPVFKTVDSDCYYYEVAVLFLDRQLAAMGSSVSTEWIGMQDGPPFFELSFPRPKGAIGYVVCLMVKGGFKGTEIDSFKSMGMQVVGAGGVQAYKMEKH